ncbi:MAG TPA: dihydrofolate reductase family protein, partial [Blastocatellia bacterium]|nr:dihydrofolate reductase family protein [Blastocatellia bacterium]
MGKVIVYISLTLDGVMQAPGRPDEDTRDGFEYGGWAAPYFDPIMFNSRPEGAKTPDMLFGRRTYQDFFAVWANRTDNPFSEVFDKAQKYVASTTLNEPLPWVNSTLLKGDVARAIAKLKEQSDNDFMVFGSGVLVQTLMQHNLVDEYILLIHPLVLGTGHRLFHEGSPFTKLQLTDTKIASTGV